jgi:hypothetical protein
MSNEDTETSRLASIMNDGACAGLHPITRKSAGASSYSRGSHFELRLPDNRLRCGGCGRQVSAHAFDIVEPGFIRAVCTHCGADLITIEMR